MLDRNERQNLGVRKWVANKCRGTLCYCTGFGKTRTAIKAIQLFLTKMKEIILHQEFTRKIFITICLIQNPWKELKIL